VIRAVQRLLRHHNLINYLFIKIVAMKRQMELSEALHLTGVEFTEEERRVFEGLTNVITSIASASGMLKSGKHLQYDNILNTLGEIDRVMLATLLQRSLQLALLVQKVVDPKVGMDFNGAVDDLLTAEVR
jgi:hypothetical protein